MHSFFKNISDVYKDSIIIKDDDYHHIVNVLRLKENTKIYIIIEEETFLCSINEIKEDNIICEILEKKIENKNSSININLFQGLAKGSKMDLIVQKCTELGINEITPIITNRVIVKLNENKFKNRKERYERIALEASKQSKRKNIPIINDLLKLEEIDKNTLENSINLIAYENEEFESFKLKELLKDINQKNINVFIGPEGGWEEYEVEFLKSLGVYSISLGPRILRTETAPIMLTSILQYELGDIG